MRPDAFGRLHKSEHGVLWDLAGFELADIQLTGAPSLADPVFSIPCASGAEVC